MTPPKNDELMKLLKDMRALHGQWRYYDGEWHVFTSLPEQAVTAIEKLISSGVAQGEDDGWRDISSAPKNSDTRVLIYGEIFGMLAWSISDEDIPDGATHWRNLPAPPVIGEKS